MENPPSPELAAAPGRDNDRESACDGIEVDVERQHCGVYTSECQRGPVGACKSFTQGPCLATDGCVIAVAERRHQGVDLHARPENNSRGPQRRMSLILLQGSYS